MVKKRYYLAVTFGLCGTVPVNDLLISQVPVYELHPDKTMQSDTAVLLHPLLMKVKSRIEYNFVASQSRKLPSVNTISVKHSL